MHLSVDSQTGHRALEHVHLGRQRPAAGARAVSGDRRTRGRDDHPAHVAVHAGRLVPAGPLPHITSIIMNYDYPIRLALRFMFIG